MKRIGLIYILLCLIGFAFANQDSTVVLTKVEAVKLAEKIKRLNDENENLKNQVIQYKELDQISRLQAKRDSLIYQLQREKISLLEQKVDLYKEKSKKSFFDSETWGFIRGVALVLTSSWIVHNIGS